MQQQVALQAVLRSRSAQQEALWSHDCIQQSVEALLDGFAILAAMRDDAGRIVDFHYIYTNEAGCRMLGHSREECLASTLLTLLPWHRDKGLFGQYVRVVETGEPLIAEARLYENLREGGKRLARAFENRAVKVEDGLSVMFRDVTERARLQEALQQSHEDLLRATGRLDSSSQERVAETAQREAPLSQAMEALTAASEALQGSREQLQTLSRRLVESIESERRSIARELHDEAGQSLTALKLGLGRLRRETGDADASLARISELERITDDVMDELHRLAMNLRPISLDRYGLLPALSQYVESFKRQTGLAVTLVGLGIEEDERLPAEVETVLYRLVQEALTNVARHAEASQVGVILERQHDHVLAIVEDDGRGFDVEAAMRCGRLGLLGMRERAEMLGGTANIESSLGAGTTVYVEIPVQAAEPIRDTLTL